ncbi:MAG TPA: HAMP domain-containing sensor histidine kinase [Verrucomicrobiae bacterium]|jgi:signal transduction histidine kinase|nr:HAMP domain-containing sensor histidine kinase [Verrucomicrobiae bacterium]
MKIRTRLTVWYATILIVSLTVIGVGTYKEIAEQMEYHHRHHIWAEAFDETSEMIFPVGLPAIFLGLLGGWWITRRALAPVTALTKGVERVHDGNLREQLPRTGNGDELDRLTEVFNAMTARLDGSFQRIREFTLHASHELKTPLTIVRGEFETALSEKNFTPEQKEWLLNQIDEIERLAKIVDGLTLLTKADAGQVNLKFEPVRLDDLVRENVADAKILAQTQNIQVNLGACDELTIPGDRHRLRQLLLNLADNAIKYNCPNGSVAISLQRNNGSAELKVENSGAGLAPDLQPRVFDRFFRGDSSHSSAVDGCGLGLSIAQWIALAHRGTIEFSSEPNKRTVVTVKLPSS